MEATIAINEPIRSVADDEDDLMDEEDRCSDHSNDEGGEEPQANNDSNSSRLDRSQPTTSKAAVPKKKTIGAFIDEFLSDDDTQPVIIQPETRALTLVSLLERVFNLLNRSRQLVSDIRNIGVVQTFISMEIGKQGRGFTLDMEVSASLSDFSSNRRKSNVNSINSS